MRTDNITQGRGKTPPRKERNMRTRELLDSLSDTIRDRLKNYRAIYSAAPDKRVASDCVMHYLRGLQDAGAITQRGYQMLYIYTTL